MAIDIGIVGLPNVGKSTLFNALSAAGAEAANFPFTTIEPNVGVVPVPDPRLEQVARIFDPKRVVPATLRFVDIAGLVRGASRGEGLGNQFLGHIREVDAVAHVVRCFEDPNVVHVEGDLDPVRDAEIVATELALKDLETVERRIEKAGKAAKAPGAPGAEARAELEVLGRVKAHLDGGAPVRTLALGDEAREALRELFLLTAKPLMYVANVAEDDAARPEDAEAVRRLLAHAEAQGAPVVTVSAAIEAEIAALPAEEQGEYLASLGLQAPGLHRVIHAGYALLELITFFTGTAEESRAWPVRRGIKAPQAAGRIHTDFERGFIRAEVIRWDELVGLGSESAARDAGRLRVEGREYVVQDGDVIHFRFNV